MSFEYRSRKSEVVIAAIVMFAAAAFLTFGAIETEAIDGETIEYVEGGGDYAIVYDSPSLDGLTGTMYHATVTDSSGNSLLDDGSGGDYFATVTDRGCVLTLTQDLNDGLYQVSIWIDQATVYNGPIIVGEKSLDITLDPMTVGGSATFDEILTVVPEEMASMVVWKSSDEEVLRVTTTGVEAVSVGKATLTATYEYIMGDVVATAEVNVNPIKVTDNGASISGAQSVQVGSSVELTLAVDQGASGYSVEWTADPATAVDIVSNSAGSVTVTGKQVTESVTITATINNYDGSTVVKTHTIKVEKVPVTSVEIITEAGLSLGIGGTTSLEYKVNPENATYKDVTWTSSDTTVATISADGMISGLKEGTATITVTSTDNASATATYNLTVEVVHVDGVSLDKTTLKMEVGDMEALVASVLPATAGNKDVTWSSSDNNVATVSNGTVTAVGLGTATITVTTVDGSKTAACTVDVIEETFAVTFESEHGAVTPSATSVAPGDDVTFTIVADSGYRVDSVTVGGDVLAPVDGVYTIQNIQTDVTVTISYVPDVVPEEPDDPVNPPYDPDDEYVPLPPHVGGESEDDTTTIVACAAAAVVAALIAVFLIMEYRKR